MRASGNANVAVCVQNLIALRQGEVFYDRLRGIDASIVDVPASIAGKKALQEVRWQIDTYEPRASLKNVQFVADEASSGNFRIIAEL